MVAVRAAGAARFADKPDKSCVAALVFGADDGLISERAQRIAEAFARREDPDAEVVRIEDPDLESDPDKLIVELQTVPMFGGGKVVRTRLSRRVTGAVLKRVFETGPPAANLVVEGGNLKPSDAARKLFDATPWAASVPCYADTEKDLAVLAGDMVAAAGMRLTPDANALLLQNLGADRALSRGEIEKLILYAQGRQEITAEDVSAVVGDASDFMMDQIVSAAAAGQGAAALRDFDRAHAAGENPQSLLLAIQRYFLRLHRLRAGVEGGKPVDDVMRGLRPPVHFKQRDTLAAQCRAWPLPRISNAVSHIAAAVKASRSGSAMETALAERLLIDLAAAARAAQKR